LPKGQPASTNRLVCARLVFQSVRRVYGVPFPPTVLLELVRIPPNAQPEMVSVLLEFQFPRAPHVMDQLVPLANLHRVVSGVWVT